MRPMLVVPSFIVALVVESYYLHAAPNQLAFRNRAVSPPHATPPVVPANLPLEVIQNHGVTAEKALLIRDPAVVDHPDFDSDAPPHQSIAKWGFANVIRRAFRRADSSVTDARVQSFVDKWRTSLSTEAQAAAEVLNSNWSARDGNYALESAPVHLLAIVNRIDLGWPDSSGNLCGAELRFAFAALSPVNEPYLNLIVEFALPCLSKPDFQGFAQSWTNLEREDWVTGSYQAALESLLDIWTARATNVRLRINVNNIGGGTWASRQYSFSPTGLAMQDLDKQPDLQLGLCQDRGSPAGDFAVDNTQGILASSYLFKKPLATRRATINPQLGVVLTLGPNVLTDKTRDDARQSLSVNSCNGCHGPETATQFHQINQRERGKASALSGFLTGATCEAGGSTSNVSDYCTVKIQPLLVTKNCHVSGRDRQYNDLLRRDLFLHMIRTLALADDWKAPLLPFAADQTH